MIEPSDSERAAWPDATREYVEALEADNDRLREIAKGIDDGGHWYSQQTMDAVAAERDQLREQRDNAEAERDAMHEDAVGYRNAYDNAADSCRAFKARLAKTRELLRVAYERLLGHESADANADIRAYLDAEGNAPRTS